MNDIQKGVITLIKSAVTGESFPLPESFSINEAYDFILKHKVVMLAYEGAVKCGISKNEPVMQKLFYFYVQGLLCSEKQMKAVNELYAAFEEKGIDYLPLKGCNMKRLYPKPEQRAMGDADILIKDEQYEIIETILLEKGYKQKSSYHQHYEWESENLYVEMHRMPMPEDYKVLHGYYGNGWSRAIKLDGYRYGYSKEDEFVFAVAHLAKHYLCGGIGCRLMTDIFVYINAYPEMNKDYIAAETEKLGLFKFYNNLMKTIDFWFNEGNSDESVEVISEFVLESGNWGNFESRMLGKKIVGEISERKKNAKKRFLKEKLFPSAKKLEIKYPILKKFPVFLPAIWPVNWIKMLYSKQKRMLKTKKQFDFINDENLKTYLEALEKSGFDV